MDGIDWNWPDLSQLEALTIVQIDDINTVMMPASFPELEQLTFSSSKLTDGHVERLLRNWFAPRLEFIDLSNNSLTDYPRGLKKLVKLDTVILNRNNIRALNKQNALHFTERVKRIDLSNNEIEVIEDASLFDGTFYISNGRKLN